MMSNLSTQGNVTEVGSLTPEKEPKSKKQKRQSEKLKCISSPKPIGI